MDYADEMVVFRRVQSVGDGENDNEIQMKVSMAGLWFEDKQTFFP